MPACAASLPPHPSRVRGLFHDRGQKAAIFTPFWPRSWFQSAGRRLGVLLSLAQRSTTAFTYERLNCKNESLAAAAAHVASYRSPLTVRCSGAGS